MIYLLVFISSILAAWLADLARKSGFKELYLFFIVFSILLPSLLAGFRDVSIGIDTSAYVKRVFNAATIYEDFFVFMKNSEDVDLLFKVLCFLSSKISDDIFVLLFFIEFLIVFNLFLIGKYFRDFIPFWLILFVFFFVFFHHTLNTARQCLSMSFTLLAFRYVVSKNIWKFVFIMLLAIGFHSTSFIFFIIYPAYNFLKSSKISKTIIAFYLIIFGFGIYFVFNYFDSLISLVVSSGLLSEKFLLYQASSGFFKGGVFSASDLILYSSVILLSIFGFKNYVLEDDRLFFVFLTFLILALNLTSLIIVYANRTYLYFSYLLVIYLPMFFSKKFPFKNIVVFFFGVLIFSFWYVVVIKNGGAESYPYSSQILGI